MDNVKASQMMTLNIYYAVDDLALLSIFVKENIKRSEFDNQVSKNLCVSTEMG